MKKLVIIFFVSLLIFSCDDMIQEDELNKLSINNEADLEFAVAGLYHQFTEINPMQLLNNRDDITFWNSVSDITIQNSRVCSYGFSISDYENGYDGFYLSMYKPLYQSIACANDIFKKAEKLNANDIKIRHLLGEVYFMRAYSYFWLVRLFGQIPIITNTDVSYTVEKGSFVDIYRFIEHDFQTAMQLLPGSNDEARKKFVTPHRGVVKALLAEVYLNWAGYPIKDKSMYAKSAAMAKEVIDSTAYFGFALVPDLADLWDGEHQQNHESVFAIYTDNISKHPFYNCNPSVYFYNKFPNNYRKDITYIRRRINIYKPDCIVDSLNPVNTYCPPVEYIEYRVDSINVCYPMYFRKINSKFNLSNNELGQVSLSTGRTNMNVIYMYRFANTLLTYAEAKARSGSLDFLAFEAVNQIRRRANKVDMHGVSVYDISLDLSNEEFADSVVWEKAWEFCAEPESRWFDLVRLEKLGYLEKSRVQYDGNPFSISMNTGTHFFPIPKADQMLNLNLQ